MDSAVYTRCANANTKCGALTAPPAARIRKPPGILTVKLVVRSNAVVVVGGGGGGAVNIRRLWQVSTTHIHTRINTLTHTYATVFLGDNKRVECFGEDLLMTFGNRIRRQFSTAPFFPLCPRPVESVECTRLSRGSSSSSSGDNNITHHSRRLDVLSPPPPVRRPHPPRRTRCSCARSVN